MAYKKIADMLGPRRAEIAQHRNGMNGRCCADGNGKRQHEELRAAPSDREKLPAQRPMRPRYR
jgi:hypothetical protein